MNNYQQPLSSEEKQSHRPLEAKKSAWRYHRKPVVEKVKVLSLSKYTSPEPLGNGQGHFEKGHFPEIKWDSNCLNLRIKEMKCYLEITGNISKMLSPFASSLGLPRWCRDKESTCWFKRCRFDTWIFRKILWSKKWQWLQYSCLGDPMDKDGGPRGNPMVGYSPRGCKESEMTKQLSTYTHRHTHTSEQ